MSFANLLESQKETLINLWLTSTQKEYPLSSPGFCRTSEDMFSNPVNYYTEKTLYFLWDYFLQTDNATMPSQTVSFLKRCIKIRAIQEEPPEVVTGFILLIKKIVRSALGRNQQTYSSDLSMFESRIDAVLLTAFGFYARCREEVHIARVNELKRSLYSIQRLISET